MAIKFVTKRDGSVQPLIPAKINSWAQWACKTVNGRVDWSSIVQEAFSELERVTKGDTVSTKDIQNTLVRTLISAKNNSWPNQIMAGALYAATLRKERFQELMPTCQALFTKLHKLGLMKKFDYTSEEWARIEGIIDHTRDFDMPYSQVYTVANRYSLKNQVTRVAYETPQFTFMRLALALSETLGKRLKEDRINYVKLFYNKIGLSSINAPSPNYNNLGTYNTGFASCCLWYANDTLPGIEAAMAVAFRLTAQSAGLGGSFDVRSEKDPVRGGTISHGGKLPYIAALGKVAKANKQGDR